MQQVCNATPYVTKRGFYGDTKKHIGPKELVAECEA